MKTSEKINISLRKLVGLPNNPRKITQADLNKLCDSIRNNGYWEHRPAAVEPIEGTDTYQVLDGNQRLKAMRRLKRKEFEERMAAGELDEDDPEYQEFVKKFDAKRTTDDCYTPDVVYNAVAEWVASEYNLSRANFVRPFYPGGDYQNEKYMPTDIVVDNPPFSIMAEILRFYKERGIRFFLFAPHLTLFSSSSYCCTALPIGVPITYANGANVNTSFLTNLENEGIRFRSEPKLYASVRKANEENLKSITKQLLKYSYDHHIITTPFLSALSRLGIEFSVPVAESEPISQLDSQRESGKAIFGKGYIVSDRVFEEREKAEREKAERWELSDREREIIKRLNNKGGV
jgi:hypothetical protein